jgi:hypothetical protein
MKNKQLELPLETEEEKIERIAKKMITLLEEMEETEENTKCSICGIDLSVPQVHICRHPDCKSIGMLA